MTVTYTLIPYTEIIRTSVRETEEIDPGAVAQANEKAATQQLSKGFGARAVAPNFVWRNADLVGGQAAQIRCDSLRHEGFDDALHFRSRDVDEAVLDEIIGYLPVPWIELLQPSGEILYEAGASTKVAIAVVFCGRHKRSEERRVGKGGVR